MRLRLAFVLLFLLPVSYGLVINEVMYDLPGSDIGREWVEVYNNETATNLSEWKFFEGGVNHGLTLFNGSEIINSSQFAVIADNATRFLADNPSFSGALFDSSFSLSNSGETLVLKNGTLQVIENLTYSSTTGASGNGKTICRYPDANASLTECNLTPGLTNTLATNTTVNFTSINSTCNLNPNIITSSDTYDVETITFDIFVNDTNCNLTQHTIRVDYLIEDLFGEIFKPLRNATEDITCSTTIDDRQWTPDLITGSEAYVIKVNISETSCNDSNLTNNIATKTIVVKGVVPSTNSSINITNVNVGSDNKTKYGESGEVSTTIYRGNTSQTAVDVYVQNSGGTKLSEITNFNLDTKFTSYSLKVPIQMKPNCDNAFSDGNHTLVVTGLGLTVTRTISVEGVSSDTCKTVTTSSSSTSGGGSSGGGAISTTAASSSPSSPYTIANYNSSIAVGEEFETTVNLLNNFSTKKNFTVYSYVYRGTEPVSLGYSNEEEKWLATFIANQQAVSIGPKASVILKLKNMIEDATEPGDYNFRVRVKVDNRDTDITKTITVTPALAAEAEETEPANATGVKREIETRITGQFIDVDQASKFLSPIVTIIKFILSLLPF